MTEYFKWLQTEEIYFLIVLEARNSKASISRVMQ
jgi:hypothetical protein